MAFEEAPLGRTKRGPADRLPPGRRRSAAVVLAAFALAIGAQLWALREANYSHREQVAIGVGARIGNGLLICLLGWLLLVGQDAPTAVIHGFSGLLTALYAATYAALVKNPDEVLIGYKG